MTWIAAMADDARTSPSPAARDPGAPIGRDEVDPELVNLRRPTPKIGAVSALGVVILCTYLVVRLLPDLVFSRQDDQPTPVAKASELVADRFVETKLSPIRSRAVRVRQNEGGGTGLRAVPVAGTNDGIWIVMTGDGWSPAVPEAAYAGRIRPLDAMPFGDALRERIARSPGPSYATVAAARAAFASGELATVTGDRVKVGPMDRVEIDVPVRDAATIVMTFNERLPDPTAWLSALASAGITGSGPIRDVTKETARLDVAGPDAVAATAAKLEAARLWAARVEPVERTLRGPWGSLAAVPTGPFSLDGATVPDHQVELVRVFAPRHVPGDARALIVGEVPADYWYVLPLVIALGLLGLLALWALVRAIKRDFLAPEPPAATAA